MEVEKNGKTKRETKKEKVVSKEEVSTDSEDDYEPNDAEVSDDGSSSGSESSETEAEEVIIEKKKKTSEKRKRSHADKQRKDDPKKIKKMKKDKEEDSQPMPSEGEKTFEGVLQDEKKCEKEEKEGKKGKKTLTSATMFDAGRVDFNLDTENPNNIIAKTVQISTSLKVACKMVAGAAMSSGRISYPDWAALVFKKKIKDGKCFEFNVSLKDAPRIVEGLKYIIEENKKFFQ